MNKRNGMFIATMHGKESKMTGADFLEWLHEQRNVDFLFLGVPNQKHPGHCLYITDVEIKGDSEMVTLQLPHTKEARNKFFVNVVSTLLVLNRSAEERGSDVVWNWEPEDRDGGIQRAFGEYVEIFYGDSKEKAGL